MARRNSRSRKRRRNRGRRLGPVFKLLCLLALVVALTAGATVFFRVEQVVVTGNSRYTQEEIIEVSGIQKGDNLYGWNKFSIAQQLRQTLPYIGEVSIRRALPSTVIITVVEWEAIARIEPPTEQELLALQGELDGEEGDLYTTWFDQETLLPLRSEISADGVVVFDVAWSRFEITENAPAESSETEEQAAETTAAQTAEEQTAETAAQQTTEEQPSED